MEFLLTIAALGGEHLPATSPVRIEVRDTSLQDAPAVVLQHFDTVVPRAPKAAGVQVRVKIPSIPSGATVWVHVDADRDGRVSKGDFVTVQSYPLPQTGAATMTIQVKKV